MPIIVRVTEDMFEVADVCSYMVNPVNLMQVSNGGLGLEFRKRVPSYVDAYEQARRSNDLRIGTIQVIEETDHNWGIINFPTKRHYADTSDADDIARSLAALREFLQQDKYRYSTVCIPMLGVGAGSQDYDVVFPMMKEHLGDLDAVVFVSQSPSRTEFRPKYLAIAGPLDYGTTDAHHLAIESNIQKVMKAWGGKLEDYEGIVSGGYPGVDAFVCGEHYLKDADNTYVFQATNKVPLVVKPNTSRDGVGANLHMGNLLCEIADDIILFKPHGHNNNRLSAMQVWLEADRQKRERDGLFPRRVAVFGDIGTKPMPDDILVPQVDDIPY